MKRINLLVYLISLLSLSHVTIKTTSAFTPHSPIPSSCPSNRTQVTETDTGITVGTIDTNLFEKTRNSLGDISLSTLYTEASGIYLLSKPVPYDGLLRRIEAFGYLNEDSIDHLNDGSENFLETASASTLSYLFVLAYHLNAAGTAYNLAHGPARLVHNITAPGSLPTSRTDQPLNWVVERNDRIGVLIPPDSCINGSSRILMCPSQVNLVTSNQSCLSALYRSGGSTSVNDLDDIPVNGFTEVLLRLNIKVEISNGEEEDLSLAVKIGIIVGLSLIVVLLLFVVGASLSYFLVRRVRTARTNVISDMGQKLDGNMRQEGGLIILEDKINTMTQSNQMPTHHNTYDEPLSISMEAGTDGYTLLAADHTIFGFSERSKVTTGEGKLEGECEYDYQEPYFEPASHEEELLVQLNQRLVITEIPKEDLKICEVLGSGAFGTVYRGLLCHSSESGQMVEEEVAVKSLETEASEEDRVKFLQEAAIMAQFKQSNIVALRGIITEDPMMIAVELMRGGDLRQYLLTRVRNSLHDYNLKDLHSMLLSYARQIAFGIAYMGFKSFVHRDIAARNILISADGTMCKIADFGLSRELQKQSFYVSHGGKIPVKWTAPEALHYRKYSTASDVWSYGCVLYEIWSLGVKPFHDMSNPEVIKCVMKGYRLHPPPGCPVSIYKIMIESWHPNMEDRPVMCEILQQLQKPDFHILKWTKEDKEKYSEEARTLGAPLDCGHELYKDLQTIYLPVAQNETEESCESEQDYL